MICSEPDPPSAAMKKKRSLRQHSHPSPALCCACGLCLMLAGINITLVGAFGFAKMLPANNPPIIIGPLLLLVALLFFGVCCMFSRRPNVHSSHANTRPAHWGVMGGTAFEMETSEHTLQDTTAIQLSPTNSQCSSHHSSPTHPPAVLLHPSNTASTSNGSQLSPREDMILLRSYDERDP
ncbi:hypothetical protein Baya_8487 [Bagarius yarrelli]|uniref:Transmembrane protein 275 n=1 Tax=Bagarius yarrelli TaxID=175774 RepID=A0A556U5S1_BAGYA|nr:hypothetical protein Baya_8487 [Bagarius yarrelli]